MNNSITELLYWFCRSIWWCYPFVLILLAGYLFLPSGRNWESINFLFVVNTLIVITSFCGLIALGIQLYETNYSQSGYGRLSRPFADKFFYATLISVQLVALLFFFRRLRTSLVFSLFFLALQLNWLRIYVLCLKWFSDDGPSSWSVYLTYGRYDRLIYIFVFVFLVCIVYLMLHLRNKLPYNSTLIKLNRRKTDVQ